MEKSYQRKIIEERIGMKRLAQLARAWGDDTVRERIVAGGDTVLGFLPHDEAQKVVRDVVLPVTEILRPRARVILDHEDGCDGAGKAWACDAEDVPRDVWIAYRRTEAAIHDVAPDAIVTLREWRVWCASCDSMDSTWYARAEYDCGDALAVVRGYALIE